MHEQDLFQSLNNEIVSHQRLSCQIKSNYVARELNYFAYKIDLLHGTVVYFITTGRMCHISGGVRS